VHSSEAPAPRRLLPHSHAKAWGRMGDSPWGLGLTSAALAIGEIHHEQPWADDPDLLVKTLFTGDRLSIQVHPDCAAAAKLGLRRGKDEAWVVLAAEPGAVIGLGLRHACEPATLRAAAIDGSIVDLLCWHACAPGDVFYTPAGTIHAIGAGVTLFEIQQNNDVTWRLHDYGRDRGLHLDEGLAMALADAWAPPAPLAAPGPGRELLVSGPGFVLERVRLAGTARLQTEAGRPLWLAVVDGTGRIDAAPFGKGEVWLADAGTALTGRADLLLAYPGADPVADLWSAA
jgi:mannose-6-phosphate isomerase